MDLFSLSYLLFTLFFLSIPILIFISRKQTPSKKTPFTPKTHPVLGILPEFLKNRHRFIDWATELLATSPTQTMVFRSPVMDSGVITANPLNIEYILKTNFENYPKGERSYSIMKDFLGKGIFNSDGEIWKEQRKTASFEFNKRSLRNFVVENVRSEIVERLLPLLSRVADNSEVVDLQDVLQRFAFDNICKVAFNVDPASLAGQAVDQNIPSNFMQAFDDAAKLSVDRFFDVGDSWRVKRFFNIGSERRLRESIKVVHDFAIKIIRSTKERPLSQNEDLLSRFTFTNSDEVFLRDILVNFVLAGRETTSSALTWFFWLMSSRAEVENRVVEEVRSIRAKSSVSGVTFSFDELREMHYLHAAISEAMRLYPPVSLDTLACKGDDVMPDGTFVRKGWFVTYSAFSMGRMETIWGKDCCEYKPERWLVDGVFQPENPFRFPIFHAGPRMCLGKEMAYTQMKSIVACVLERFEIEVVEKEKIPGHVLSLTLRMEGGLPIRMKRRG